jgi:HTH-type transcriptional regulator / antitoxin HipB
MRLRHAHDLRHLIADGRKRAGWTQSELADRVGVSRQWISMVENGKTRIEFDLVFSLLRALGLTLFVETEPVSDPQESTRLLLDSHDSATGDRTPLTRQGKALVSGSLHNRQIDRNE